MPELAQAPESSPQTRARQLAQNHYENFTVALPGLDPVRYQDLCNIYYFSRVADDYADEIEDADRAREALDDLREAVRTLYEDQKTTHPVTEVIAPTVRRCDLPLQPFLDLISAFLQDLDVSRYETFEDLVDYCSQSANPVGRLVLAVFDRSTSRTRHYSDCTCTALQLTNFWADVELDLDRGRIYLPAEDRERFGVREEDLTACRFTPALRELLAFEVERTRDWFRCGWELVDHVGGALALMVELYNAGGWAVLDQLEEQGYQVFKQRWTLSSIDKFWLIVRGLWRFGQEATHPPG